jgi:hypothetical protein
MSTGSKESNQARTQDTSGGNIVGKAPTKQTLYKPPNIFGKSGQSDNQSTSRPKGST